MNVLLLHPPQAKPAEPPAGIPLLAGTLRAHGCLCTVCDLNLEGLYYLLSLDSPTEDTWSKRAFKNRNRQLQNLQAAATYENHDRYRRAVADLNRVVENCGKENGISLSLANYQDPEHSPLKSEDLLQCGKDFENNLFFPHFSNRIHSLIAEHKPQYIGLSLNYLSQAPTTFAIAGFIKKTFPSINIILGGGLVTTWMQNPGWVNPFGALFDHMVCGPGEHKLLEIIGIENSGKRCPPDYTDLLDKSYLSPGWVLPYATSVGCFWRKCSFCPETSEKNPYIPVPTATVISEVHELIASTRPSMVHFLDNAISPAVLTSLTRNPLNVPWYGFVRFTSQLADPDFCKRLRDSGCVMLKLGLESGSQDVLDQMHKGIDLQLVEKVLLSLHQAGISTYVYLLFGTPAETHIEAKETLKFVAQHHEQITFLNLAIFNLPNCSAQAKELEIREFYEGDLSIYTDFIHPHAWGRKEIRRFLDSEFKREPVIHSIMQNDPLIFTSNHAPFFCNN